MICQSPAQSLWFFRQYREERSCHARFPSGWKDSFQTNRLRHAPSTLRQPQRTSTGCLLHHSMWDPHTTLHSNMHAICTMQYVALALVCLLPFRQYAYCAQDLYLLRAWNTWITFCICKNCSMQCTWLDLPFPVWLINQKWFQTDLMRSCDNNVTYYLFETLIVESCNLFFKYRQYTVYAEKHSVISTPNTFSNYYYFLCWWIKYRSHRFLRVYWTKKKWFSLVNAYTNSK